MEAVFPSNRNVFLNEFSIPASKNCLSFYFKQYSFIQILFSANENCKIQFLKNNFIPVVENVFLANEKPFLFFHFQALLIVLSLFFCFVEMYF